MTSCVRPLDGHFCVGLIEDGGQAAREDPGYDRPAFGKSFWIPDIAP